MKTFQFPRKPATARGHTRLAGEVVLQTPLQAQQGAPSPGQDFPLYEVTQLRGMISPCLAVVQKAESRRQHKLNI